MHNRFAKLFMYFVATAIVVTISLIVPPLLGGSWMPDAISTQAKNVDNLFVAMLVLYVVILSIVTSIVVYCARHFRARHDDDGDGEPLHGHHKLEIVWTIVPAIIVTVISIFSYLVLVKQEEAPAASATKGAVYVQVKGFQFGWNFSYLPYAKVAASDSKDTSNAASRTVSLNEQKRKWAPSDYLVQNAANLVLPVSQYAFFDITVDPKDVLHSFWVPESRMKEDAVPGVHTRTNWTPGKINQHEIQVVCAELCGAGHNTMRADACVVSQAAFDAWVKGGGKQSCKELSGGTA